MESYCRLTPGVPADLVKLEQFIIFLLAGSVAEMVAIEPGYQLTPQSTTQRRFRQKWFIDAWDNPEPRVDAAYFAIVAWMPGVSASDIAKEQRRLWTRRRANCWNAATAGRVLNALRFDCKLATG